MKMKRLVLAALLVTGCGVLAAAAAGSRGSARALGTVTVRTSADWPSFDPEVDAGVARSFAMVTPGYDYLVALKPGGKFGPYLATSWVQKPKGITFTLRQDAKCTDGHVLTALDVLNSLKRFIFVQKRTGSVLTNGIGGWGPGPYHLHTRGKFKLSFFTDAPFRNHLGVFAGLPIICPAGLAAVKSDPRALETAIYGSGPYTLDSAAHGSQIVWKLRPEWHWGPPGTTTKTMPTGLVYKVIGDDTTATNLLLTGGMDIAAINGADVNRLLTDSSVTHIAVPNYQNQALLLNMRAGRPFADDEKLREAVMTAVDPKAWNTAQLSGRGLPATSVFRTGAECYDPKTAKLMPTPSLDKAKQILQSDGYTFVNGKAMKNGQQLQLNLLLTTSFNAGSDYLAAALQQLGIDVQLSNLPLISYGAGVLNGNFDVTVNRGFRADGQPGVIAGLFSGPPSPQGGNIGYAGGGDPVLSRYANAGLQNVGAGSCRYFALFQERLLQQHYLLPLLTADADVFVRKGISAPKGYSPENAAYPWYSVKAG